MSNVECPGTKAERLQLRRSMFDIALLLLIEC